MTDEISIEGLVNRLCPSDEQPSVKRGEDRFRALTLLKKVAANDPMVLKPFAQTLFDRTAAEQYDIIQLGLIEPIGTLDTPESREALYRIATSQREPLADAACKIIIKTISRRTPGEKSSLPRQVAQYVIIVPDRRKSGTG